MRSATSNREWKAGHAEARRHKQWTTFGVAVLVYLAFRRWRVPVPVIAARGLAFVLAFWWLILILGVVEVRRRWLVRRALVATFSCRKCGRQVATRFNFSRTRGIQVMQPIGSTPPSGSSPRLRDSVSISEESPTPYRKPGGCSPTPANLRAGSPDISPCRIQGVLVPCLPYASASLMAEPQVQSAMARYLEHSEPAVENLDRLTLRRT